MRKMVLIASIFFLFTVSITSAWAGGDKVRGEEGDGEVNQVNFNNQDKQN